MQNGTASIPVFIPKRSITSLVFHNTGPIDAFTYYRGSGYSLIIGAVNPLFGSNKSRVSLRKGEIDTESLRNRTNEWKSMDEVGVYEYLDSRYDNPSVQVVMFGSYESRRAVREHLSKTYKFQHVTDIIKSLY